ncbi:MAG TPA: AAA family ATPase [Trichocoleus sp.]
MKCPLDGIFILYDSNFNEDPNYVAQLDRLWDSLLIGESCTGIRATKRVILLSQQVRLPQSLQQHYRVFRVALPTHSEVERAVSDSIRSCLSQGAGENRLDPQGVAALVQNCKGMPEEEIYNLLRIAYVANRCFDDRTLALVREERLRQLTMLNCDFDKVPETQVKGYEALKQWVQRRLKPAFELQYRVAYKIPMPKGIILVGPQGCGKTLISKIVAKELGVPSLKMDIGKMMSQFQGKSEENVRRILEVAEAIAPCILRIDELDKAGLGGSGELDSGTSQRILAYLLSWMSEPRDQPVFIIGTMNRLGEGVPVEFTRKGRFDEIFLVDLPNRSERRDILAYHLSLYESALNAKDLNRLASETKGFSGAELEELTIDAFYIALQKHGYPTQRPEVSAEEVFEALAPKGIKKVPDSVRFADQIKQMRLLAAGAVRASAIEAEEEESIGYEPVISML